jgi:hypothetical protein
MKSEQVFKVLVTFGEDRLLAPKRNARIGARLEKETEV